MIHSPSASPSSIFQLSRELLRIANSSDPLSKLDKVAFLQKPIILLFLGKESLPKMLPLFCLSFVFFSFVVYTHCLHCSKVLHAVTDGVTYVVVTSGRFTVLSQHPPPNSFGCKFRECLQTIAMFSPYTEDISSCSHYLILTEKLVAC